MRNMSLATINIAICVILALSIFTAYGFLPLINHSIFKGNYIRPFLLKKDTTVSETAVRLIAEDFIHRYSLKDNSLRAPIDPTDPSVTDKSFSNFTIMEDTTDIDPPSLKLMWDFNAPRSGLSGYVADLDNDGYGEVIVDYNGSVQVFNYDGTLRWNTSYLAHCVLSLHAYDLDGDGYKEVIVGSSDGYIRVYNYNGSLRWRRLVYGEKKCIHVRAIYDLDGDGYPEIIVSGGERGKILNYKGEDLWSLPQTGDIYDVYVSDLDSDGQPEIVIGGTELVVCTYNGTELWRHWLGNGAFVVYAYDLEGDGQKEVIAGTQLYENYPNTTKPGQGLFVFSYNGTLRWRGNNSGSYVYACDLDHDGYSEVIGSGTGGISVYSHNGTLKWSNYGCEAVLVTDLEGDSYYEIIASGVPDYLGAVYNYDGSVKYILPFRTCPTRGTGGQNPLFAYDLDSDGLLEIIAFGDGIQVFTLKGVSVNITFSVNGLSNDASGVVLTVDDINYSYTNLSKVFSWNIGSSHTFEWKTPITTLDSGKRYVWSASSGLSTSRSGSITVPSGGGSITATYKTQYKLHIYIAEGSGSITPSPNTYWHDKGSSITVSATPSTNYEFNYWILDSTKYFDNPITVLMKSSHDLSAYFKVKAYEITFNVQGLSSDASGVILTVDGVNYYYSDLPKTFTWNLGSSHTFEWHTPIPSTYPDRRYIWNSSTGLSTSKSGNITVSSGGGFIIAYFKKNSLVTMPIQLGNISFVNMFGSPTDKLTPDRLVVIQCKMTNLESITHNYTFIVQVKDENGVIVSFSFITGKIYSGESMTPGISWTPSAPGNYTVEVYVWENFTTMKPLAKKQVTNATVKQS